jgi:hypothetical protein
MNQEPEKVEDSTTLPQPEPAEKAIEDLLQSSAKNADTIIISASPLGKPIIHHTKNLYPVVRHLTLIVLVLLFATLILFLMHQNGKSIYDNGI